MTFDPKAVLLEKLELIKEQPKKADRGICAMLDMHTWAGGSGYLYIECVAIDKVLKALFVKWPEFSGHYSFPVPQQNKRDKDSIDAFHRYKNLWGNTPYGRKRHELLDWMINELKGLNQ